MNRPSVPDNGGIEKRTIQKIQKREPRRAPLFFRVIIIESTNAPEFRKHVSYSSNPAKYAVGVKPVALRKTLLKVVLELNPDSNAIAKTV